MGKIWLITGSSRGLGRALTEAVLATGEQVVATARKPEQLDDLVQTYGGQMRAVVLDVTDTAASRQAVQAAVDEFGGLDVVANNAGYANSAPIEETSNADFRAQIETNPFGVVNVTKAALPVFRGQRSGHFLQFSSVGGRVGGTPGRSVAVSYLLRSRQARPGVRPHQETWPINSVWLPKFSTSPPVLYASGR
jgi:NAD(P)-dependent dehydrogenase (short-subunit alcohol dehydrogenase family)